MGLVWLVSFSRDWFDSSVACIRIISYRAIGYVLMFLLCCHWFALFVSDGCVSALLVRPEVFLNLLCF